MARNLSSSAKNRLPTPLLVEQLEDRVNPVLAVSPTQNANTLIQTILGADVTPSNIVLVSNGSGATASTGTFTGGTNAANNIGIASGIILSSGAAAGAVGPNNNNGTSTAFNAGSDADLASAIPNSYKDASSLQFDFVAAGSKLAVQYVVASEEYEEYVTFADAFAFLLQDLTAGGSFVNVATLPGTNTGVSIGTVNQNTNNSFYRSNTNKAIDTQYDGMTTTLTANATLTPGHSYRFKFVIADKGDATLDSSVFIKANSFTTSAVLPSAVVNIPGYNTQLSSAAVPSPTSFTVTSGALPPGLTLNPTTGQLTGTPTQTGKYTFAVVIANAAGASDAIFYSLTVDPPRADLQITKTNNQTQTTNGAPVTYTIVVTNAGPSPANGAVVADSFPAGLENVNWTAVATGGAVIPAAGGTGNINQTITTFPSGATVTYTVTGTVTSGASGNLVNTATVTAPAGVTDPTAANNSATDSDQIVPSANLSITKTDGGTTAALGQVLTYTVVVSNAGPSNVTGARVTDTFPATLTNVRWTAVFAGGATGAASGVGAINQLVNVPNGGSVTYTVTATVSPTATPGSSLANTATVTLPSGVVDPVPADNSATDTNTLERRADLRITTTDNSATEIPGTAVSYTIVVTNDGPSPASGVTVSDTFDGRLSGLTIKSIVATTGASSSRAAGFVLGGQTLTDTVTVPGGGSITYVVSGTLAPSATGTLSNTATVAVAAGTIDPNAANNSATDTSTLVPTADLQISTPNTTITLVPGTSVTYTFTVENRGPSNAPGSIVSHPISSDLQNATWTAAFSGGATGVASGSGPIAETLNLPTGGTVVYTVTADVIGVATSTTLTGTVTAPPGVTDPVAANNTMIVTANAQPAVDLRVDKVLYTPPIAGQPVTFTIVVTNGGPSFAVGASISDVMPAELNFVSWTTQRTGTAVVQVPSGFGNISGNLTLAPGDSVTYTVTGTLASSATSLTNTATVTAASGELNPADNVSMFSVPVAQIHDVAVTVTDNQTTEIPGTTTSYTVVVSNNGPSDVAGVSLVVPFSSALTGVTWMQTGSTGGATGTASGTGDLLATLAVPAGGTITYTVNATVTPDVTGVLSVTGVVTPTNPNADPDRTNNSATDVTTLTPQADLAVTNAHTQATVVPGLANGLTYTITVANTGPSDAPNSRVVDGFPVDLGGVTWTASYAGGALGPVSGTGGIDTLVNLPAGGSVTFTATGTVSPTSRGQIANTATATTANGVTDPTPGNNAATDTTPLTPQVDLVVTKTDNQATAVPGTPITYVITVTNNGPSSTIDGTFIDTFAAGLQNVSWTTTHSGAGAARFAGPGFGTGNIAEQLLVDPNSTLTITVTGTIASSLLGTLSNTATAGAAAGESELVAADNSATDTSTLVPSADVQVTVTADRPAAFPGDVLTYTVVARNAGPSDSTGVALSVPFPTFFAGVTWAAVPAGGATGATTGTGDINQTIGLPAGASLTYTVQGVVLPGPRTSFTTVATATPGQPADPGLPNNTAQVVSVRTPEMYVVGAGPGSGPHVKVYAALDGRLLRSFFAFDNFAGGVAVALADIDNDGFSDVIAGAGAGAPSGHVKVFSGRDGSLLRSFFAFDGFAGGLNVAGGDINGDGRDDIIVGTATGSSHVKVFDGPSGALMASFFAYGPAFAGGVTVGAGDFNNDGLADVVTGAGPGAPPHVKVLEATSLGNVQSNGQIADAAALASFFAFAPAFAGGVFVTAGADFNNDGVPDLVVGAGPGAGPHVKVLSGVQLNALDPNGRISDTSLLASFLGFGPGFRGGVRVGEADADADGIVDLVVGAGPGSDPDVRLLRAGALTDVRRFDAFDVSFTGGVFVD